MTVDLLLGLQWGDEGKGKIVDVLTSKYDIIARFQGGPNAGHTLEFDGIKHVLRTIPSGIFHKTAVNIIGNGVVIDPVVLQKEIEKKLEEEDKGSVTEQLDNMLEDAKIGPELIASLGEGMRSLSDQASKISNITDMCKLAYISFDVG